MKYWLIVAAIILISGCARKESPPPEIQTRSIQAETTTDEATPPKPAVNLPDLGEAPELTNEVWLNVDQPLRLADLRGQVVLIDMWTFG